jgi:hypothetical protein
MNNYHRVIIGALLTAALLAGCDVSTTPKVSPTAISAPENTAQPAQPAGTAYPAPDYPGPASQTSATAYPAPTTTQ